MKKPWHENENWQCLKKFLPDGWEEMAQPLGVWRRRPRSIASTEALLRLMLVHLADGCSLRETTVRARKGGLADISDVALMKRLQASGDWFRWMALQLLQQRGAPCTPPSWLADYKVRTVDASVVCEPGSTGTDWRVHYSLELFGLHCDEFYLTGPRVGESFLRFHVSPGDLLLGDRAYGHFWRADRRSWRTLPYAAEKQSVWTVQCFWQCTVIDGLAEAARNWKGRSLAIVCSS
jgi:hypothetical protein